MVIFFVLSTLSVISGTLALEWTSSDTFPNGTQVQACVGDNVTLPWTFTTSPSERVVTVDWFLTSHGQSDMPLASYVLNAFFVPLITGRSVAFRPNAGIHIPNLALSDFGFYTVHVNLRGDSQDYSQTSEVQAFEPPVTLDGKLHAYILPESTFQELTGQWHIQLGCSKFVFLGEPPVSVVWKTPLNTIVPSTSYSSHTFYLTLPNPLEEGDYSCLLSNSSAAKRCLQSDSPLNSESVVYVAGIHTRLSHLEGRMEALQEEASNVTGHVDVLTSKVNDITEYNEMLARTFKDSVQEDENNSDMLRTLRLQNDNLTGVVSDLQNKLENLTSRVQYLEDIRNSMTVRVDDLQINNTKLHQAQTDSADKARNPAACHNITIGLSGIYTIYLSDTEPIQVYCDQQTDNGGWTVIQRRLNGSVDFYRNWTEYERGFGNLMSEFWIGLRTLHYLTRRHNYTLRIDLTDFNESTAYAIYKDFYISGADDNYRLHFGKYDGTAGDSLASNNRMQFTTQDRDHDPHPANCGQEYLGAWWYLNGCGYSNLNGRYNISVYWYYWKHNSLSVKRSEMKIRHK